MEQIPNQPTPSSVINPQPPPIIPSPRNNLPLILVIILLIVLTLFTGVVLGKYLYGQKVLSPMTEFPPTTPLPLPTTVPAADFTINWKTYSIKTLALEFKLPPIFDSFGELTEQIIPGEKGTSFCMTFPNKKTLFFIKPVVAGAAACVTNHFGIGTTSIDFEAGRMAGFTDLQGYIIENGKYYAKLLDKKFEIPSSLVTQMGGPGGLPMLKIIGKDSTEGEFQGPISGTPGNGRIGALINTSNKTYPGLAVEMELTENLTEDLFDQILSTFKFLDSGESGMTDWKTYIFPKTEFTSGFKIYYPSAWKLEISPTIKFSKENNYFEIRQGAGSVGSCLFPEDQNNPNAPSFAEVYKKYIEIDKKGDFDWRLAVVDTPKLGNDTHFLCEKPVNGNFFTQGTRIGFVPFRLSTNDQGILEEVVQILKRIEIF